MSKVERAAAVIGAALSEYKRPCVLWSGGKDSMVMLHLLLQAGHKFPVVCWREPWMPWKQAFTNRIISEWGLEVWDYAPSAVALCKGKDRIDVMNHYSMGPMAKPPVFMILARGTERPEEGLPWLCGRDTFLSRPLGSFDFPWDCMFHGHKSSDVDPCSGAVPLQVDFLQRPGAAAAVYPLRDWTDEDVFAYIEEHGVPYDRTRYARSDKGWEVLPDKRNNPDYYHACFACCERGGPDFVTCPKTNLQINNISEHIAWVEPRLKYCGLRTEEVA